MGQYISGVGNGWLVGIAIIQTDGAGMCIAVNTVNDDLYIASKANSTSSWMTKKI